MARRTYIFENVWKRAEFILELGQSRLSVLDLFTPDSRRATVYLDESDIGLLYKIARKYGGEQVYTK